MHSFWSVRFMVYDARSSKIATLIITIYKTPPFTKTCWMTAKHHGNKPPFRCSRQKPLWEHLPYSSLYMNGSCCLYVDNSIRPYSPRQNSGDAETMTTPIRQRVVLATVAAHVQCSVGNVRFGGNYLGSCRWRDARLSVKQRSIWRHRKSADCFSNSSASPFVAPYHGLVVASFIVRHSLPPAAAAVIAWQIFDFFSSAFVICD